MKFNLLTALLLCLPACGAMKADYTACSTFPSRTVYTSQGGTKWVFVFNRLNYHENIQTYFELNDEKMPGDHFPNYFAGQEGFFVDGIIYIPPDFASRAAWDGNDMACRIVGKLDAQRYNIACEARGAGSIPYSFLFSTDMGIELIAAAPIETGTERGEAYFWLTSGRGLGAECGDS